MALRSTSLSDYPSQYHAQRMSEAEYLALPDEKPHLEYVDGVVLQRPMPDWDHANLEMKFAAALDRFAERSGGRAVVELRSLQPARRKLSALRCGVFRAGHFDGQ